MVAVCSGEGEKMIQPILDELTNMEQDDSLWEIAGDGENAFISTTAVEDLKHKERSDYKHDNVDSSNIDVLTELTEGKRGHCVGLDCEKACDVVVRAFRAAAEREISVGDGVNVWIVKKNLDLKSVFGTPSDDTNRYLIDKRYFTLPSH